MTHKRTVHKKVPGKYRCEQCDCTWATPDRLNVHRRVHTGERPYACTECAMKFACKTSLQSHYRCRHTDERPFACDICDQRFSAKYDAQQHRLVHTFSKPFMCDVDGCEKRFTEKGSVLRHKRIVHEKLPGKYRCEQCDCVFMSSSRLRIHRRTHTGERPFACTDCEMTFARKGGLQDHFDVKHTLERPLACAHCQKTFATVRVRTRHTNRVHKLLS